MRRTTATALMEPLRVVLGARMTLSDAARRLATHQSEMAPVVSDGDAAGILSRSAAEHATRMGAGKLSVAEIVCGGAPRVGRLAGPALMKRRTLGVSPGLIVCGPGRLVAGVIARHVVDEIPDGAVGNRRNLRERITRLMDASSVRVLRRAGALASQRGVGLHLSGGVVRDLLMGTAPRDLDLVVEGDGIAFAERLSAELGGKLTRHERFGTAVIRIDPAAGPAGVPRIDVATARSETYEHPAALPRVEPGSIADDIHRRDVTINSMTVRLDGRRFGILVDLIDGQRDLRRGALQVHHRMSLADDPTRAFRIARFAARFGFRETEDARRSLELARALGAFEQLGGERLHRELVLFAAEPEPWRAWRRCAASGLLADIGPALRWRPETRRDMERFFRGVREGALATALPPFDRALVMLMLLARGAPRAQRTALAARLRITGRPAGRLAWFEEELRALTGGLSREPGAGRVVRLCEEAEPEILALAWTIGGPASKAVERYLGTLRHVRPTLTGAALREMGLAPGPGYAGVLARLREAILDGRVRTAEEERAMAARLVIRMNRSR